MATVYVKLEVSEQLMEKLKQTEIECGVYTHPVSSKIIEGDVVPVDVEKMIDGVFGVDQFFMMVKGVVAMNRKRNDDSDN